MRRTGERTLEALRQQIQGERRRSESRERLNRLQHQFRPVSFAAHASAIRDRTASRVDRDSRQYDFSVQAVNLNQAKEGTETAVGFYDSLVSAFLDRPADPTPVIIGK